MTYLFLKWLHLPGAAVLFRLQIRLRDDAMAAPSVAQLPARFHRCFVLWFALGRPAFLGVMLLFALMLLRGWFPHAP